MKKYYAHSKKDQPPENWQPLEEHLKNVADLAAKFAEPFGAQEWACLAGLWHDVGKATCPWQAYLRHANEVKDEFSEHYRGRVAHAIVGAQQLLLGSAAAGKLLAYCLAGHHGGLPNWDGTALASLKSKIAGPHGKPEITLPTPEFPVKPPFDCRDPKRAGYQLQFFTRMLFSCLVDADFLDTESAIEGERSSRRNGSPKLPDLHPVFWHNFNKLREQADPESKVNWKREAVLDDCLKKAVEAPGLFSLTVPTGGGKTLASLAFALEHARRYGQNRIIYVIPFTSIIEQNAQVFRQMLGDEAVLEHHCNFIPDESNWQARLAAENWDAPVIVTTNVQFFDSLYANGTSKSRKLHNLSNSIVIFDEVQAISVEKLKPCLEAIRELSRNYGVTSVLCTATQPALEASEDFPSGLQNVRKIVDDVPALFSALKRTKEIYAGELATVQVAKKLAECEQVLCIVNTRRQALEVFSAMPEAEETFHLSALMYPAHRNRLFCSIRRRLEEGRACRVVSTQLIEAGVDVDFPCVYRAAAGIDSIAQAAGRCNRNGLHKEPQEVHVFRFPENEETGFFRKAAQSAAKLFDRFTGNLTAPDCVREYFDDYFWKNEDRIDNDGIVDLCNGAYRGDIQFADIAKFHMIDSVTIPVVIALEEDAAKLVGRLVHAEYKGGILRKLQKYTVQVYPFQFDQLENWCENPMPGVWVLRSEQMYSQTTGLRCKPPQGNAFFG